MMYKSKAVARMGLLVGLGVLSSFASAFIDDAKILIDRALNSPTLTVRYSGAAASMVELRINGISLGTRTVNAAKNSGETNFSLDLAALSNGENDVEVRLFDKSGKLIGTQKSKITSDDPSDSPVRLVNPKMGSTIMGPVEIKVGFGKELRNVYVSFFVNNQFRSMTNLAPYSFVWDTTREPNGWHELEAWIVDENSSTLKTKKTKVFVNNPSGRTNRRNPPVEPTAVPNTGPAATGNPSTLRNTGGGSTIAGAIPTAEAPGLSGVAVPNAVNAVTSAASGLKATKIEAGITAGPKLMAPGSAAKASAKPMTGAKPTMQIQVSGPNVSNVVPSMAMLPITRGSKVSYKGTFTITLDSVPITFDVQPRVTDGVPLTPVRHLLEAAGGEVDWQNDSKTMTAFTDGREIYVRIGDRIAKINNLPVEMEIAPFLEKGRTIVPLSFIRDSLEVEIQFDSKTGHVLITSAKKKN
jgi:hypothetical protein